MRPTDRSRHDAIEQIRRAEQARSASRRMIARGERPGYRVAETGDGSTVHVVELPWLEQIAADRHAALGAAREAIALARRWSRRLRPRAPVANRLTGK